MSRFLIGETAALTGFGPPLDGVHVRIDKFDGRWYTVYFVSDVSNWYKAGEGGSVEAKSLNHLDVPALPGRFAEWSKHHAC